MSNDPLMQSRQVRSALGDVSDMTIWRWVKAGILPEPIKIRSRNYWPQSAVLRVQAGEKAA